MIIITASNKITSLCILRLFVYRTVGVSESRTHISDMYTIHLSLSYCFQSLRLVCSSSHELLILGISVRIFLMRWFPLAFCMIVFRHTVGLLWISPSRRPLPAQDNTT
jgi:hypothetical protein